MSVRKAKRSKQPPEEGKEEGRKEGSKQMHTQHHYMSHCLRVTIYRFQNHAVLLYIEHKIFFLQKTQAHAVCILFYEYIFYVNRFLH